jgi:hypothetical protein
MKFYHDFSILGLRVPQRDGIYPKNQAAKAPVLIGYLAFAIGKLRARNVEPITFSELFCADAYYSFIARRLGVDECYAYDNDRDGHLEEAKFIQHLLSETNVHLKAQDVFDISSEAKTSIVMNAGGLYHVSDPLSVLDKSYEICKSYLILQSVVSLANEDENYFETPAPGWDWGCRFSHAFLRKQIAKRGYRIIDEERNILEGNLRPEDRGSSYFFLSRE